MNSKDVSFFGVRFPPFFATNDVVEDAVAVNSKAPENAFMQTVRARSLFLTCAHWLSLTLLSLSLWSGLNLARDQSPGLPLAWIPGMQAPSLWHVVVASAWVALTCAYLYFLWKKRRAREGQPTRALHVPSLAPKQVAHSRSKQLIYVVLVPLLVTGLSLLSNGLGSNVRVVRNVHLVFALAFVAVVSWHLWVQWGIGAWKRIRSVFFVNSRKAYPKKLWLATISGLALFGVCALTLLTWWQSSQVLFVPKISGEVTIDGEANEAQWQHAASTVISTYYGMNEKGHVPVEIKMMNDGYSLYVHAKWPDASKSMRHLPLLKTAQGWRVQQTHLLQSDEKNFYEDKFAVMLGTGPWDALSSVFLSNGETRGGHRMPAKKLVDVWHWKSVRNHGFANLDDAYFSSDLQALPGQRRYPWGYGSDPLLAGSYAENWDYFLSDVVRPLRLPRKPEMLAAFQALSPQETARDPVFGMHWVETQPYDASLDTYPVGTVMPSVVWYHPNEGDRADVRAAGVWKDGYWHLEMARNFETDSDYDQRIVDGIYLWFSSFDHSQTRHTYHLRPVRLKLGK